jgi:deoxyribonuclease V
VTSFKALAEAIGDVRAAKAIYEVLRQERPKGWHRVLRSDGSLPFEEAAALLRREGLRISGGRVEEFQRLLFSGFESRRPLESLREEQRVLSEKIVLEDAFGELRSVAGFDVSYGRNIAYAAAVVMEWGSLNVLEEIALMNRVTFPYISTYLAYREFDAIARCYRRLRSQPSVLLVDGNGILHPASFGIACLVGVRLDRPTIGVAKSLLMGRLEGELTQRGQSCRVIHDDRGLGYAYWPPGGGKPIYVSPGHRVSPETALDIVKTLCRGRVPEPLRLADQASRRLRREAHTTFNTGLQD